MTSSDDLIFVIFRQNNDYGYIIEVKRREFVLSNYALENILGQCDMKMLWKAWDELELTNTPTIVNVTPEQYKYLRAAMIVRRMTKTELNPPEPYHMAIYDDEGIAAFQIPIVSSLLFYKEKKYYVRYLQNGRFRLELLQ